MGLRRTVLAKGEIYHIYNQTGHNLPLFKTHREYKIFLEAVRFYLQSEPPVRFSIYRKSRKTQPVDLSDPLVRIICFCLMPTHYHFILRQIKKDGIQKFIQRLCNSYSHYFNIKNKTSGSLFSGNFKAVRVENNEQLLHLSRYIHLNPVTAYLVENSEDWFFSSHGDYLGNKRLDFLKPDIVLDQFSDGKDYGRFVRDRKDYQRRLKEIKTLVLE
jgi:putative transposase